ncbi:MAG: sulfatase-like hydrolase/transferase [Acidobacteriota bacterium]
MSSSAPRSERAWRLGAGVLLALLVGKFVIVTSIGLPFTAGNTLAFFWQDIATGAALALVFRVGGPPWLAWTIFWLLIGYVALSVPITVVLGSPLTWTMIRAARGALSDSIRHHLTAQNLATIGAVGAAGLLGPWVISTCTTRMRRGAAVALLAAVAFGRWSAPHVETVGLERNALTALIPRGPGPSLASVDQPSRLSPFPVRPRIDDAVNLADYRGAARGMNVLLIVLESTAARYLKPYGAADDPMPAVTAFSRQALIYDRAYAAYPESVKGLYSSLCGRMPVFGLPAEEHATLPCAPVAQSFATAGYRTALFHSGRFAYLGMAELLSGKGFMQLDDAGAIGGHVQSSFGVDEDATVDRLVAWIDAADATTPFFATYLPVAGHHPYATTRPGPFAGNSEFGRYQNALHEADGAVDRLLQALRDRGLERRTLVMIVGDHGEAFGQHPGNAGHTLFIYDENVHVPWLIAIPGLPAAGRHIDTVTSLVDLPSTMRDLVGLPMETADHGQGLGRWNDPIALFFTDYSLSWAGLRDGCWSYLYDADADRSQLFDECHDADQAHDRSADESSRVAAYRARVRTAILGRSGNMVEQP